MLLLCFVFFEGYGDHRDLHVRTHSFPTRRSSDLSKTPGSVLRDMPQPVRAQPEEVLSLPVVLSAPASIKGRQDVVFTIRSVDGEASETVDSTFFGPM